MNESNLYSFEDYQGETSDQKDEDINRAMAAAEGKVYCAKCSGESG